ncbi:MAG: DUF4249 domain-containing protein, partial [Bacteroidota bacterium]
MKRLLPLAVWFICLGGLTACIDPFTPDLEGYESALVVNGRVLQGKEVAEIRLSRATPLEENEREVVEGALVSIRNDVGQSYRLEEIEPGVYQSDTNQLAGVPGLAYQLEVEVPGGSRYESDWETMSAAPPIEDLSFQFEEKAQGFDTLSGMQVYLSTNDP